MAFISDPIRSATPRKAGFWQRLGTWMEGVAERQSRYREILALQAKSDDELAHMGLNRADVPAYVLRSCFYV